MSELAMSSIIEIPMFCTGPLVWWDTITTILAFANITFDIRIAFHHSIRVPDLNFV